MKIGILIIIGGLLACSINKNESLKGESNFKTVNSVEEEVVANQLDSNKNSVEFKYWFIYLNARMIKIS